MVTASTPVPARMSNWLGVDIRFATGGLLAAVAKVGPIPWQNRPTFQQVVQIRP